MKGMRKECACGFYESFAKAANLDLVNNNNTSSKQWLSPPSSPESMPKKSSYCQDPKTILIHGDILYEC